MRLIFIYLFELFLVINLFVYMSDSGLRGKFVLNFLYGKFKIFLIFE
jgi:hypothetical protein